MSAVSIRGQGCACDPCAGDAPALRHCGAADHASCPGSRLAGTDRGGGPHRATLCKLQRTWTVHAKPRLRAHRLPACNVQGGLRRKLPRAQRRERLRPAAQLGSSRPRRRHKVHAPQRAIRSSLAALDLRHGGCSHAAAAAGRRRGNAGGRAWRACARKPAAAARHGDRGKAFPLHPAGTETGAPALTPGGWTRFAWATITARITDGALELGSIRTERAQRSGRIPIAILSLAQRGDCWSRVCAWRGPP